MKYMSNGRLSLALITTNTDELAVPVLSRQDYTKRFIVESAATSYNRTNSLRPNCSVEMTT